MCAAFHRHSGKSCKNTFSLQRQCSKVKWVKMSHPAVERCVVITKTREQQTSQWGGGKQQQLINSEEPMFCRLAAPPSQLCFINQANIYGCSKCHSGILPIKYLSSDIPHQNTTITIRHLCNRIKACQPCSLNPPKKKHTHNG